MKNIRPLIGALSVSLLASQPLVAADKPKPKAPAAPAPAAKDAPEAAAAPSLPAVVAVVEGAEIKGPELEKTFNSFLASKRIPADALPPAERSRGYQMILEEMIKEKLIEKRSAAMKVTDEEVTETFKKYTASLGPEEEVKKQIEASGQTLEGVREDIRASLRQNHWVDTEIEKAGGVGDKDAETFYKANPQQFLTPDEVRASHILVRVPPESKPEVVVEKQKAAQVIADRVKKGEDFAALAKELSEDPSAKENSGDLNFFGKEQMVPEFSEAAFKMKTGEISEPVRSQFGYHVIKVTDRHDAGTMPLDTVKPQLLTFLKGQKVAALMKEIREKAEVKINLPAPAPEEPAAAPAPAPKK